MNKINTVDDLLECVDEYGIIPFWTEDGFSTWQFSGVNFISLWNIREQAVNSLKIAYGKFVNKKATFVSLAAFPYLCALRRDGYDFDSLSDEGKATRRETELMAAVGDTPAPSFELSKTLGIKGFDGISASLQNKTYLCLTFKKSTMGTALLNRPESLFGNDFVRSQYALSPSENANKLSEICAGLKYFDQKTRDKILSIAI